MADYHVRATQLASFAWLINSDFINWTSDEIFAKLTDSTASPKMERGTAIGKAIEQGAWDRNILAVAPEVLHAFRDVYEKEYEQTSFEVPMCLPIDVQGDTLYIHGSADGLRGDVVIEHKTTEMDQGEAIRSYEPSLQWMIYCRGLGCNRATYIIAGLSKEREARLLYFIERTFRFDSGHEGYKVTLAAYRFVWWLKINGYEAAFGEPSGHYADRWRSLID